VGGWTVGLYGAVVGQMHAHAAMLGLLGPMAFRRVWPTGCQLRAESCLHFHSNIAPVALKCPDQAVLCWSGRTTMEHALGAFLGAAVGDAGEGKGTRASAMTRAPTGGPQRQGGPPAAACTLALLRYTLKPTSPCSGRLSGVYQPQAC
jgi:hypothetical protein